MEQIFITGANRGLGLELAHQYLKRGNARIFASCRNPGEATALHQLAADYPERLSVIQLDVADEDSIARSLAVVREQTSALDIFYNNAAINPPRQYQAFGVMEAGGLELIVRTNTIAPLMLVQAYIDLIRAGTNPRIVNVSSQVGSMEWKTGGGSYGYAMSKAGLNMVTRCLAADLRGDGITVITLHPGWVQTDMGGKSATLTPEESVSGILKLVDGLTAQHSGEFFKWDGSSHPW